ncbi:MAG: hypothetical protein ACI91O_000488 [Candidatus Poriferisodalaceae bacterium]
MDIDRHSSSTLSRRRFFGLGAGAIASGTVLAACSGSKDTPTERAASKFFSDQTVLADGTPQRTIWSLSDDEGNLGDIAPETIDVSVLGPDGNEIHAGTASAHRDGVALPYYPLMVPFTGTGVHEFKINSSAGAFVGFVTPTAVAANRLIQPGQKMPSVVTPTLDAAAEVDPICTRNPVCPFHDHSLDSVLGNGTPLVVIVSTPAFCGTVWMCGPVLENLIDASAPFVGSANFIHTEVYAAPTPELLGATAPIIDITGAVYEPYMFVIDGDGTVLRRLDHLWDRAELNEALALLA